VNINDVIAKVIDMPKRFSTDRNISIVNLLKESGYIEAFDQINESYIYKALTLKPERIHDWLIYSENKRTDSGWYFLKDSNDTYVVGYFPDKNDISEKKYPDAETACAAYIKKEIENIRSLII
jgi:ribosomal protein S8